MINHVLTVESAQKLGIIDANGDSLPHSATLNQVASASESSHDSRDDAIDAARRADDDRVVIDSDGNSTWIGFSLPHPART
jgi:hypothetical protein